MKLSWQQHLDGFSKIRFAAPCENRLVVIAAKANLLSRSIFEVQVNTGIALTEVQQRISQAYYPTPESFPEGSNRSDHITLAKLQPG